MWSGDIVGSRRTLERTYRDLVDRGHYTILWETLVLLSELETRGAFGPGLEYAEELVEITVEAGYEQAWRWACGSGRWPKHTSGSSSLLGAMRPRDSRSPSNTATYPRITKLPVLGFLELSLGDPRRQADTRAAPRPARPQGHRRARRVPVRT